jgi:macrolide transport system ATP-binding/permease protein
MEFIELRNIHKTYHLSEIDVPVLKGISLTITQGEFVALMGPSGSGKTSLMNILGCLDHPTSGEYWLDGHDMVGLSADVGALLRNQKFGFVFQNYNLLPRTDSLENVIVPLTYTPKPLTHREARGRAADMLRRVGLSGRQNHEPSQLSGGEQQRVAIARALINHPEFLFADEPTGNLDSRTAQEILALFRRLNQEEGVTIILVTHDQQVASTARRVIKIRDGVLEPEDSPPPEIINPPNDFSPPNPRSGWTWVRLLWLLRTALAGLRRNLFRTLLTTLGIVIGVAAVIAVMEIGHGSANDIQQAIATMGVNNLIIYPGAKSLGAVKLGAGTRKNLTPLDSQAIQNECPAIKSAAPMVWGRTQLIYGNRNWVPHYLFGTTPDYLVVREWGLAAGQPFTQQDVRQGHSVCLIGQTLARELFRGEGPLGKEIMVKGVPCRVLGILKRKGVNMFGSDQDDVLLLPWTTLKLRVTGNSLTRVNQSSTDTSLSDSMKINTLSQRYPNIKNNLYPLPSVAQTVDSPKLLRFINVNHILAASRSPQDISVAINQIRVLLRERHRLAPSAPDDFRVRDWAELIRTLVSTNTTMKRLLVGIALISLLVGGVGIMNIMLVSVTERTQEIGVRLAVGAGRQDILWQFLAEALILCFCGGAGGIIAGRGASLFVRLFLGWPTQLSLGAIAAAIMVSAMVGLVFGFYPAWKASNLDPIVALHYE